MFLQLNIISIAPHHNTPTIISMFHDDELQAVPGGKFNQSRPKNYIDQAIYERVQFPGPCEYDLPEMAALTSGGRFNSGKSKTDVEWQVA